MNLLSESAANDELDSDQNNDSAFETSLTNDFQPTDSMTIGELADQKPTSNRTVAIDEFSTRKPVRMASFEGKTNGKTKRFSRNIKDVFVSKDLLLMNQFESNNRVLPMNHRVKFYIFVV